MSAAKVVIRDILDAERDALAELYETGEYNDFPKGWLTDTRSIKEQCTSHEERAFKKCCEEMKKKKRKDRINDVREAITEFSQKVEKQAKTVEYWDNMLKNAKMEMKVTWDSGALQRIVNVEEAKSDAEEYLHQYKHWLKRAQEDLDSLTSCDGPSGESSDE